MNQVDGSFLGELRESDLMDSIGMEHKLHLKKLLLARQKLTPLSAAEQSMASSVRREDQATAIREEIPDVDTAFSQVRDLSPTTMHTVEASRHFLNVERER